MDTTVESGSSRVHNIGLMNERLIITILGSVIFGAGLINLAITRQESIKPPIKQLENLKSFDFIKIKEITEIACNYTKISSTTSTIIGVLIILLATGFISFRLLEIHSGSIDGRLIEFYKTTQSEYKKYHTIFTLASLVPAYILSYYLINWEKTTKGGKYNWQPDETTGRVNYRGIKIDLAFAFFTLAVILITKAALTDIYEINWKTIYITSGSLIILGAIGTKTPQRLIAISSLTIGTISIILSYFISTNFSYGLNRVLSIRPRISYPIEPIGDFITSIILTTAILSLFSFTNKIHINSSYLGEFKWDTTFNILKRTHPLSLGSAIFICSLFYTINLSINISSRFIT
jgi:hypothetical protein